MTPTDADYEDTKAQARSVDPDVRRRLAQRPDVRPEILYFLAEDPAPDVRRAIAANAATPRQADMLLARDVDAGVRGELARKIALLLPDLSGDRLNQVQRMTLDVLEALARDQAAQVRQVLAETLKDLAHVPEEVINRLARDVEIRVAGPVLRHSPILTDEDLLDIIRTGPTAGALTAIAERGSVAARVSEAIARTTDEAAIAALLANPSAQIREETLDYILDMAPSHEPWHAPLVRRPRLPARAAARLAQFVTETLLRELARREDLDPATAREIARTVQSRLAPAAPAPEAREPALDRVRRMAHAGELDETAVSSALAAGDRAFALHALAELSGLSLSVVERILGAHSARGVIALVWRAGLSMRLAVQAQLRLAHIPPQSVLNARDGVGFPMTEDEMTWQLGFFGAKQG